MIARWRDTDILQTEVPNSRLCNGKLIPMAPIVPAAFQGRKDDGGGDVVDAIMNESDPTLAAGSDFAKAVEIKKIADAAKAVKTQKAKDKNKTTAAQTKAAAKSKSVGKSTPVGESKAASKVWHISEHK